MPDGLLCVGEGYHFGVGMRTVRRHDEIHPNGYEPAGCGFEHGGAEGSAGFQLDIGQRQLYDEAHTVASGQDGPLLAMRETDGPRWKTKGRRRRESWLHNGNESFSASRFFVTMASPFFVDTSMPVAQTVRHSSIRPSLCSDWAQA